MGELLSTQAHSTQPCSLPLTAVEAAASFFSDLGRLQALEDAWSKCNDVSCGSMGLGQGSKDAGDGSRPAVAATSRPGTSWGAAAVDGSGGGPKSVVPNSAVVPLNQSYISHPQEFALAMHRWYFSAE